MDEQERPTTDAAEGSEPRRADRGLAVIGIIFLVVGVGIFVGPGDGGVAFIVLGVVLLAAGGALRRR